jgi:hypothetical protein
MRTNINIEDSLINQGIRLSKLKTKREVVQEDRIGLPSNLLICEI